jgi:glutathione S-transferase
VQRFLKERQIEVPVRDVLFDKEAKTDLLRIGGKTQVPCLIIDGQPLYESNDIIDWFRTHYVKAALGK